MPKSKVEDKLADLLALADIQLNGNRPWDIQIHNNGFFNRPSKTLSFLKDSCRTLNWLNI